MIQIMKSRDTLNTLIIQLLIIWLKFKNRKIEYFASISSIRKYIE